MCGRDVLLLLILKLVLVVDTEHTEPNEQWQAACFLFPLCPLLFRFYSSSSSLLEQNILRALCGHYSPTHSAYLHCILVLLSPLLSLLFLSFERGCASIVSCSSSSALRSLSLFSLSHSCSSWNTSAASTLPLLLSCLSCTRCFADYCCCVGWLAGRQSQSVVVVFAVVVVAADSLTAQTHSLTRN